MSIIPIWRYGQGLADVKEAALEILILSALKAMRRVSKERYSPFSSVPRLVSDNEVIGTHRVFSQWIVSYGVTNVSN